MSYLHSFQQDPPYSLQNTKGGGVELLKRFCIVEFCSFCENVFYFHFFAHFTKELFAVFQGQATQSQN